jgi:hypothetical protein
MLQKSKAVSFDPDVIDQVSNLPGVNFRLTFPREIVVSHNILTEQALLLVPCQQALRDN